MQLLIPGNVYDSLFQVLMDDENRAQGHQLSLDLLTYCEKHTTQRVRCHIPNIYETNQYTDNRCINAVKVHNVNTNYIYVIGLEEL